MTSERTLAALAKLPLAGPPYYDPNWDEEPPFPRYFDRDGERISMRQWAMLFGYKNYQIVKRTDVGPFFVSTVWLGLDHSFDVEGLPLIFETMVFSQELDWKKEQTFTLPNGETITLPGGPMLHDYEQWRHSTEEEALDRHQQIVDLIQEGLMRVGDPREEGT